MSIDGVRKHKELETSNLADHPTYFEVREKHHEAEQVHVSRRAPHDAPPIPVAIPRSPDVDAYYRGLHATKKAPAKADCSEREAAADGRAAPPSAEKAVNVPSWNAAREREAVSEGRALPAKAPSAAAWIDARAEEAEREAVSEGRALPSRSDADRMIWDMHREWEAQLARGPAVVDPTKKR